MINVLQILRQKAPVLWAALYPVRKIRRLYLLRTSPHIPILKEIPFKKIYHIKDKTVEDMRFPRIYKAIESGTLRMYHPAQDILEIDDASVFTDSDMVQSPLGIYWDKSFQHNFSIMVANDRNLLYYNNDILIRRKSRYVLNRDICCSMLGVYAEHWVHWMLQYLPKLYYMKEAGLLDNRITILLPNYKDNQIRQIVQEFLSNFSLVDVEYINKDTEIKCKKLIYVPSASISGDLVYTNPHFHGVFPKQVLERLRFYLINPLLARTKGRQTEYSKIYLPRPSNRRGLTNNKEVEEFFTSQGFHFVDPASLSLEEKVILFNNASVIVGPGGSAFSNLIFCQEHAKALMFCNRQLIDLCLSSIRDAEKLLLITGQDIDIRELHTSYTISLEKIKEAYNYFFN
jgi:hypothetical protein